MNFDKKTLVIRHHLGAGDHLISNAIYRHFAADYDLLIPCKRRNIATVQFMTRDLTRALWAVDDDTMADRLVETAAKRGCEVLKLGMFADGPFDEKNWDKEFYRVAGIQFEKRWSDWKMERNPSREFTPPPTPYVFLHEDVSRGFKINRDLVPGDMEIIEPGPHCPNSEEMFWYNRLIEEAEELHLIDSCFAILADSLNTMKAKQKVIHLYSRPNALPPTYKQEWTILR